MATLNIKINLKLKIVFINFFVLIVGSENGVIFKKNEIVSSDNDVIFKKQIDDLKQLNKLDIIFLIDGSSSVGLTNFECELNFVKKLLSDFTVSENRTKVSVVVFGSNAIVYEHSDKCELLNSVLPTINYPGSNTNTLGAFLAAREILQTSRKNTYKVIFLVTDGFSNGGSPIPIVEDLKKEYNLTIFTLGIVNGNRKELEVIRSQENTSYFLESFEKFDLLARKALHTDLKEGDYIRLEVEKCGGCDPEAICTCGTSSGHYSCKCRPGYFGTGKINDCTPCPKGTWHDKFSGICMPCPDYNHVTNESSPATSIEDCKCKVGYKKPTKDPFKCEVMRCPKLKPPENGYFVGKTNCPNVLNSACGVRCNVGYSLRGTSIRICRENGQWDGLEPQCHLKTCPRPPIPVGGEVFCNNTDLDITFKTLPDEMPVDTECIFNCEAGSNLIGSTKRTCLPIEQWDGLKTTCKTIKCIKIPRVPHGKVFPQECTREKQKHGTKCNITCGEGFSGPGEIECISKGRHGAWSTKPRCIDNTPPKIICPKDQKTVAIFGENFGLIHWEDPQVIENSNSRVTLWWEPMLDDEDESGPYKFEIGETLVTYFAVDQSGNAGKCNFTVTVMDLEPPKFIECTNPPPFLIGKEGIVVEWDEPLVVDNSGNEITVERSKDFGPLPPGIHQVEYKAVDMSNNTNSCILNITVALTTCENEVPQGLDNCNNVPNGLLCVLTCEEGYAFSMSDKASCETQNANWIIPECTPTEIPKEISGEIEKDCLELKKTCIGDDCELLECEEDNRIKRGSPGGLFQVHRVRRQTENKKRKSKFRIRINKNIDLEQKFKGVVAETLRPLCRNGSIPLKSKKFRCVKCPKGFFHNTTAKNCEPCPLNHYNDKIGATKCLECPPGTLTRGRKGSKGLKACKIHLGGKFRSLVRKEPCKNDTCVHGKCVPVGSTRHRCQCDPDWVGVRCRIRKVDHCALEPCLNGGSCTLVPPNLIKSSPQVYSCNCLPGFTGSYCELEELLDDPPLPKVNICKQVANLCENGGICQPDKKMRGDYKCLCPPGFLGKRCQNVPCDYRPCPDNNICVNILEDGRDTTKKSFKCNCPEGKANPPECLVDVPLLDSCGGCQNNGTCLPNKQCICTNGFLGPHCEEKASENFILEFPTSGMTDFAILKAPQMDLTQFTLCSWLQTNNTFNYGTILSYATSEMDNTLTLIDFSGLVLWVNGKYAVSNIKINDGSWHHVCISWKATTGSFSIFVDSTKKATGSGLSVDKPIKGGGVFVLGQDQDFPGGGFSSIESFVGKIAHMDIWNRTLDEMEMTHKCGEYQGGNYVAWSDFRTGVKGKTKIMESDFCRGCKVPSSTVLGGKWQINENGSIVTLTCQVGYVIHLNGNPHPMTSLSRHCLASGRWQDETIPISCGKVYCAPPPRIRHGRITNRKRLWRYGDVVNYLCIGGTKSRGQNWKTCGEGGRWTNETFECIGENCPAFSVPNGANWTIISEHVYDEDILEIQSFDLGTMIEITCLNQSYILTCQENQTWDRAVPKCQEELQIISKNNEIGKNTSRVEGGTKDTTKKSIVGTEENFSTSKLDEVTIPNTPRLHEVTMKTTTTEVTTKKIEVTPVPTTSTTETPKSTSSTSMSTSNEVLTTPEVSSTSERTIHTSVKPNTIPEIETTPKIVVTTSKKPNVLQEDKSEFTKKEEEKEIFIGLKLLEEKLKNLKENLAQNEKDLLEEKLSGKDEELIQSPNNASKVDNNPDSLVNASLSASNMDKSKDIVQQKEESTSKLQLEKKLDKEIPENEEESLRNATKVDLNFTTSFGINSKVGNTSEIDSRANSSEILDQEMGKTASKVDQTFEETSPTVIFEEESQTTTLDPNKIGIGCEGIHAPSIPDNGYLAEDFFDNLTVYEVGTVISFRCRGGYDLIGMNFTTCLTDGRWSDPDITCEPVKCPYPPKYSNMFPKRQLGIANFHFGNMVNYECDVGFTFYGNNVIRCQANGRWSRMKGKCARISCGKPVLSPSEIIIGSSYLYKDSLHIMCPTGSTRNHYEAKCTHTGQWLYIGNCNTPGSQKNSDESQIA